ncbi:MAG TPA: hypothetical protein VFW25_01930 [Silvibacterium sp.]|nr:hypothetical protein [Silvibacterium sp.]
MNKISRRDLFGMGFGAAATAGLAPLAFTTQAHASNSNPSRVDPQNFQDSVNDAFIFQNTMMDAYATGDTVRLIQSYSDQNGLLSTAFTYDNAVSIHAYLVRGQQDDLARAEVLGNGLIYAQATNFPINDGRFAQGYYVNVANPDLSGAFITPAAVPFFFYTSAVGDQAWAGMALTQLYRRTGQNKYLTAALKVANWIVTNTYNTLGPGGYSFGTVINPDNTSSPSTNGKSTEHNIDTYAFFAMLDTLTHNGKADNGVRWFNLAQHALSFVLAMYNSAGGFFWTGTLGDQVSINFFPIPEDCQTWSYLALLDNKFKATIDWALANLENTDTASATNSNLTGSESISGLVFSTATFLAAFGGSDPNAVWLEGTSHTIASLVARANTGNQNLAARFHDIQTALSLMANCRTAQSELGTGETVGGLAIPAGLGLLAATSTMDTGFGFTYGPALHIGATGWYLIAALGGNPFQLGYANATGRPQL